MASYLDLYILDDKEKPIEAIAINANTHGFIFEMIDKNNSFPVFNKMIDMYENCKFETEELVVLKNELDKLYKIITTEVKVIHKEKDNSLQFLNDLSKLCNLAISKKLPIHVFCD